MGGRRGKGIIKVGSLIILLSAGDKELEGGGYQRVEY